MANCKLCGLGPLEIGGWLERVNELGVEGIWECRPDCKAILSMNEKMIGAIKETPHAGK